MRYIDEELKVLNTVKISADICIDDEKKRFLLNALYELRKNSEERLKRPNIPPGVLETMRYNIKKADELHNEIRKIDKC